MAEEKEDDSPPVPAASLDWEKLFKLAEDPDIEDMERGPLETAILNLQGAKEIHKLNAIKSFPELIRSEGEEAIQKMFPAIQQCLRHEKSNLDIHCEAAVVFKEIAHSEKLCTQFPTLLDTLLDHILQNITGQKDNQGGKESVRMQIGPVPSAHHLSAAAWLETLVDIAHRVPIESVKEYIVPVVKQQAESVQRVQRRIIATKLVHKLAEILPPNLIRKELGPCVSTLCRDPNANVRTSISQKLPTIAKALKNSSDVASILLPCLVELCKDDELNVKEASLNNLSSCMQYFTNEAKRTTVFPLIKDIAETSLEKKNDILMVVSKHLGQWTFSMLDVLDQLDRSWVLNTYLKIGNVSQTNPADTSAAQALSTMCRRMCAYNLPAMVEMFPKNFERIQPVFEAFCSDSDDEVRMAMAASFHEILKRQTDRASLLPPFIDLIRGGAPDVVAKLTKNLDKMLPIMYKIAASEDRKISVLQLDRILIGCNQLLRSTGSWRAHESLLNNLAVLTTVRSFNDLFETFIPVLQREVLQVRALPCRIAAANTLLIFMREQPEKKRREEIIDFFKLEVASHTCSYRRMLFLDVVEAVLKRFSRRFFVEYFLQETIKLTEDNISNIRLKAIRILPGIKSHLILPEDDVTLLELEKSVRTALQDEKQQKNRVIMQSYACELSRCESRSRDDREDQAKVEEEDILWNEERVKEEEIRKQKAKEEKHQQSQQSTSTEENGSPEPQKNSGLRPPSEPVRATSPWRMQRRAVAVVRPQPVVVMRSASPVPKFNDDGRPSRLPLSTASKDARKGSDSGLPRPSMASSSVSTTVRSSSANRSIMSNSTSSLETTSSSSTSTSFGLRRSATTTVGLGSTSTSSSVYPLMSSRSVSNLRRPTYGLTRVSSHSTLQRKPGQVSIKIRPME